jgi:hypothetical protein
MSANSAALPNWLTAALESRGAETVRPNETWPRRPRVGEFSVLESMDPSAAPRRVVLVIDVDASERFALVALVTNETEVAGARDIRLAPAETSLPYDAVVESDVVGTAWWAQLGAPLGKLDTDLAFADEVLTHRLDGVPAARLGLPIVSSEDSRWQWKKAEAAHFRRLTADCSIALVDEADAGLLLIDDGLVAAAPEEAWEVLRDLNFAVDLIRNSNVRVDPGALAAVGDPRALPVPAGLGMDALTALTGAVHQAPSVPLSGRPRAASEGKVEWRPGREGPIAASDTLADRLAALAEAGVSSVHLATSDRLWASDGVAAEGCALLELRHRRIQIVTHTREEDDVAA